MRQIVCTVAVGSRQAAEGALGFGRSLKLIGDETRRVVITDQPGHPWAVSFDEVLAPAGDVGTTAFQKLSLLRRSDADQVLAVEFDALAFRRLGAIFDFCRGKSFAALAGARAGGNRRGLIKDLTQPLAVDTHPKVDSRLIYYERTPEAESVIVASLDNRRVLSEVGRSASLSQCIASAIASSGFGTVLPEDLAFYTRPRGRQGPLRLDVNTNTCRFVCCDHEPRLFNPYIFAAWSASDVRAYRRQLARLAELERYAETHRFGFMSPAHKFRRSIEKRILRLMGKL